MKAKDILGPTGPLARSLAGYEARGAQLAMAEAVERALREDRKVVCEAGTGTGKTLAYLVPAILSGRRVVISTATKALQEQIFTKDLPLLAKHAGLTAEVALVKGLGNYLCRRRYDELRRSEEASRPSVAAALAIVDRWVHDTETGDLAELVSVPESDPIRAEIASGSETRIGSGCSYFDRCFVTRMRRDAEAARIVVVNHHLFFADLALRGAHEGGAIPPYDAVIFDEAHQIEDVATDFFGVRVSSSRIDALVRDARRAFAAAGLGGGLLGSRGEGARVADGVERAAEAFFAGVRRSVPGDGKQPFDPGGWADAETAAYHALDAALEAALLLAESASGEALDVIARRASQIRDDLARVVDARGRRVTYAESSPRAVALGATPVDVGDTLRARLFESVASVVMTSATLATSSGFDFFRARVGLDDAAGPVDELALPSPFDFGASALLYVPRDLPEVSDPGFVDEAAARVARLVAASGGGAFVLCTSVRNMRALHARLRARGVPRLLLQGEAPKTALLSRFRAHGDAVLCATMSFWEGVDVPGRALRLVVIDKLPFPVPSDPHVAARSLVLEEQGENPFLRYHVPTAAISLKQGFGRLIRTATDRGVVALLDRRARTRGYGISLLDALPPARRTESVEETEQFLRDLAGPALPLPL